MQCWFCLCTIIHVPVLADARYFVLSLADSVWWPIFSRAVMMSLHEAVGVESSQCWSRSILHRAVPSCGHDVIISFSLLTGTSKATPSEYQSFIPTSSSVSWWMVGVVIPVHKRADGSWDYTSKTKQRLPTHNPTLIMLSRGVSGCVESANRPKRSGGQWPSYWLDRLGAGQPD